MSCRLVGPRPIAFSGTLNRLVAVLKARSKWTSCWGWTAGLLRPGLGKQAHYQDFRQDRGSPEANLGLSAEVGAQFEPDAAYWRHPPDLAKAPLVGGFKDALLG